MLCTVLGIVLGVLVALYALFELHYFLRMCLCVVAARYIKKRMHILETATVTGEFCGNFCRMCYECDFLLFFLQMET